MRDTRWMKDPTHKESEQHN